jgi:hypothetical protein
MRLALLQVTMLYVNDRAVIVIFSNSRSSSECGDIGMGIKNDQG